MPRFVAVPVGPLLLFCISLIFCPMLQTKLEELEASSQQLVAAKTALEAELAAERTATESLRTQTAQEAADLAAKLATLTRQGCLPYFN
jgi:hypothetical protein